MKSDYYLGIFEGHSDPTVALVKDGEVVACAEEERHLRWKHAHKLYPIRALRWCLDHAGIELTDVKNVAINLDLPAYSDGRMAAFFEQMSADYPVDDRTRAWQKRILGELSVEGTQRRHEAAWRKEFGAIKFPPLKALPHHYTHAFHAAAQSTFDRSVVLTIDGSGDKHCTVLWKHEGTDVTMLRELTMPHSLGWVYAAFTEYLGFAAYDGEYKVMGLAAYGRSNPELIEKVDQVVQVAPDGVEYRVDPTYIHYGDHTWSDRFTDKLCDLFGRPPRLRDEEITSWHEDLAWAVQDSLERAACRLVSWGIEETGFHNVCVGGGCALNVKMNTRLFHLDGVEDLFAQPLCNDGGAAAGAALTAWFEDTSERPKPLKSLALGYEETNERIEEVLKLAKVPYTRPEDLCQEVANELASGNVVGWFQGRMESGPRALGSRSILADPRKIENRDKVNAIIKFREYWRPFCPSMLAEAADGYLEKHTAAPFMIIAFRANEKLKSDAPAIVHVDGTARVQLVEKDVHPRYHRLIEAFGERTGVPVLLNTSFNVKGEPIVCTIHDALRTFWATGLDVLAAGDFLIKKPLS